MKESPANDHKKNAGDHLANERTFLAWVRTSIGIMGFGFVVVKFSLFVRQIAAALGSKPQIHSTGYSPVIGVLLVSLGALTTLFSYIRYTNTKKQLEQGQYYQSSLLIKWMTAVIFLASILLIIYLIKTT
ncbi:YidH family protein [Dyadobacter sp.]|uniref:YidH family protein n=1 Tax=Dyadobacter sp. TaxID=1914288 RepID=UPI003F6EDE65